MHSIEKEKKVWFSVVFSSQKKMNRGKLGWEKKNLLAK